MTEQTDSARTTIRSSPRRSRWWLARRARWLCKQSTRRRLALPGVIVTALALVAAAAVYRLREAPKVEPSFESIALEGAGPVRRFALADVHGAIHRADEWSGKQAIVLVFFKLDRALRANPADAMAKLAAEFVSRGVLFLAVCCDPAATPLEARQYALDHGLSFPVLLDPRQVAAAQAGVRAVPEAVVLAPDGQVLYRGRARATGTAQAGTRPAAALDDLGRALRSIVCNELPAVFSTATEGSPLPEPPPSAQGLLQSDEPITFAQHIAPILWKSCVRCHRPGDVGPFSLLTYKDAAKRAGLLEEVTADDRMPPWQPHPGAGVFLDAPRLSSLEKEMLKRWASTGKSAGDPADLPAPPVFHDGWQLGEPELVLTMPEPFDVPADGPDIYRSFTLQVPSERDLVVAGLEFQPGNRRVVHHSRIYLDEHGDALRLDRADPAPGYEGGGGEPGSLGLPYPGIGAWTPGMTPRLAPEGVGRTIPGGSHVVLHIHYHPTGKPERDQSRVGLFLARKPVTKTMAGYSLCTDQIDIPPGVKRHKIILSTCLKADVHLYSIVPHAHYLCREFRLAATLPGGSVQPLLWITDWNMDWQDQYRYLKPVRLPKGTVLTLAAYFDNSADNPRNPHRPPVRVRYGVATKDEMCACHLEFLPDDPSGYAAYPAKSPFGL